MCTGCRMLQLQAADLDLHGNSDDPMAFLPGILMLQYQLEDL